MKKNYPNRFTYLDEEEREIAEAFENGKLKPLSNLARFRREFKIIAENTLKKKKNINIRISESTLSRLKAKAIEEGLPYQTLASSILHKYANK